MDKINSRPRIEMISSKCAVWSCENNNKPSDDVTYFNIPTTDKGRCLVWLLNAGRIDLVNLTNQALTRYVFCELHFEASQFVKKGPNIRKLVKNAVPTLFGMTLPLIPLQQINPSLVPESSKSCVNFKNSSKPSSINAANAKCYKCSKSYATSSDLTLYFFPVDDASRYYAWIINSGESHLLQKSKDWVHHNCLLCSDHFETSQFEENNSGFLRAGAIPTLFRGVGKATIPAPIKFDSDCRKPFPLLIKTSQQSSMGPKPSTPKVAGVKTVTLTPSGNKQSVPIKINVPQIESPKSGTSETSLHTYSAASSSPSKENQSTNRTYRKAVIKPNSPEVPKTILPKTPETKTVTSTIFFDATGKTASNHPLANVISTFLAHHKGHTGDLLITDGTPNGVKYLIRQNKPGSTQTVGDPPSKTTETSPVLLLPPRAPPSPPGPTIVRSSIKSLSVPEKTMKPTSTSKATCSATSNKTGVTKTYSSATKSDTSAIKSPSEKTNEASNGVAKSNISSASDSSDVQPQTKTQKGTTAASPADKLQLPEMSKKQSDIDLPETGVSALATETGVNSKPLGNNALDSSGSPKVPANSTGQQPFTIVQKNVESVKQNGSTTCKSTFVIRGNGPLSSAQLESIIKDNLLKNGTIKDGAKILIRHKGGAQPAQTADALKNEAFVVKQSKIVPLGPPAKKMNVNTTATKSPSLAAAPSQTKKPSISVTSPRSLLKSFSLNQEIPLFRYPKGVSPEKMAELRRIVRRHQVKINRQAKIIERLKKEKKEKVQNLPLDQLAKLVQEHMPGFAGTFFRSQLMTLSKDRKKYGHRWDDDTKVFSLGLWNRSPAAFKLMQRAFNMPSMNTLTKWVANVPPEIDFFEKLKEVLSKAVKEPSDPFDDLANLEEPKDDDENIEIKNSEGKSVEMEDTEKLASVDGDVNKNVSDLLVAAMEQELEPDEPHNQEPLFPDEQEPMDVMENPTTNRNEEQEIIEKVCIDLDADSGMHVVEEIVSTGHVLVDQLIVAAGNSNPVILQT